MTDQLLAIKDRVSTSAAAARGVGEQRRRAFESVWVMVGVALIIRLVVMRFAYLNFLDPARDHFAFGFEFGQVAKSIATGQGFSSPYPEPTGPTAMVGPVYAYLLAGVFKLFGVFTTASALVTLTLNNLWSALICLPVFFIARRSFGPKIAVWSGWAWAFYPHTIAGSNIWVWETILTTLLLTLLLLYTLKLEHSTSYLAWLGYGFLWAITALTSANVLSTFPFFVAWIFLRQWRSQTLRWGPIIVASLVLVICMAPWTWRSSRTYGRFVAFRSNLGLEVLVGNSSDTSRPSNWNVLPGYNTAELEELQRLGEAGYTAEKQRQAMQIIKGRPLWFAGQTLRRILFTWTNVWEFPPRWNLTESGWPDVLTITLFSVMAFIGLRRAIRTRWEETIPFIIPLAFFPLIYYVTHQDDGRFRHPVDPVIVILAVCGAYSLFSKHAADLNLATAESESPLFYQKEHAGAAGALRED